MKERRGDTATRRRGERWKRRCVAVALCLWSLTFCFTSAARVNMQKGEDRSAQAAAEFPKFVDEYLNDNYARHPSAAAATGLHAWDGQLEDYSSAALNDEIAAIKKFQARLQKIPAIALGLSDILDYQILASNMQSRLLEL